MLEEFCHHHHYVSKRGNHCPVYVLYIVQRVECYIQYDPGNIVVTVCIRRACAGGTLVTLAAVSGPAA